MNLRRGFTLIELLVVIAIIALLVGILLPSLANARKEARAIKCASNQRQVAIAVLTYASDSKGYIPPSYVYGLAGSESGTQWTFIDQQDTNSGRPYIHWSYTLFESGTIPEGAFSCPDMYNGGAPAANPGADSADREAGQSDDTSGIIDRQAKRVAYAGNAALFPRNKFNGSGQRRNKLATTAGVDGSARGSSKTILVTEFYNSPGYLGLRNGSEVVKSHRSITPFIGVTSGQDVYGEGDGGNAPRFGYPNLSAFVPNRELNQVRDAIENGTETSLNAVGRHHPGNFDADFGGSSMFAFVDGHVERMHVRDTVRKHLWGDAFWTLTGSNIRVGIPHSPGN